MAPKPKGGYTVADVLKPVSASLPNPVEMADSLSNLELIWKKLVGAEHGFVLPWSKVDHGIMKTFLKACPEGKACALLTIILEQWKACSGTIAKEDGVYKPPTKPNIKFLVGHRETAINFALGELQAAASEKAKAPAPVKIGVVKVVKVVEPPKPSKPVEPALTPDMMLAILKGAQGDD